MKKKSPGFQETPEGLAAQLRDYLTTLHCFESVEATDAVVDVQPIGSAEGARPLTFEVKYADE